ncbi:MAG: LysR family transcriptional regulator [Coxiellaceae bacterium]|nr:LysR family transcriptional regulator [Coxiellaceae bacterium]
MVNVGFSLRQIQVFVLAAKTQNLTRVSEQLHLSVPAISKQIKALEHYYEVKLFEKKGNRLVLTQQGRHLLPVANDVLAQAKIMDYKMHSLQQQAIHPLHLHIGDTYQSMVFAALEQFNLQHENTDYKLDITDWSAFRSVMSVTPVEDNNRDTLYIGGGYIDDENFYQYYPLKKMKFVLLAHPSNSLVNKTDISVHDLNAAQWVISDSGSEAAETIKHYVERINANTPAIQLTSFDSIKQALLANLGIAMLPEYLVKDEIAGHYKHLAVIQTTVVPEIYMDFMLYHLRAMVLTQQQITFIQFLQEYFSAH